MIIFLYGPDTYRSRQKLNEIIERYKKIHKSGLNLRYFEEENLNFQDFKNVLETCSMFREKKLIVLKEVFSNKDFQEKFLKQGEKFVNSDNVILIYQKQEIDKKNPFFNFLKKKAKSQEFELLEREKLKNWVKKELGKYQARIESGALDRLINFVGSNLWQMENEVKKLASYRNGEIISERDVELLIRPQIETDIFKTIDAIAQKQKSRALTLLHQHLEKGDSPLYLLSMINFQFRNLIMIKDLVEKSKSPYLLSKITNLHPYIIKKSYSLAKKFTIQELKKIYQKIFQIDLAIKTGKTDPETALDILIAEI